MRGRYKQEGGDDSDWKQLHSQLCLVARCQRIPAWCEDDGALRAREEKTGQLPVSTSLCRFSVVSTAVSP
jgi:hypothetical protein